MERLKKIVKLPHRLRPAQSSKVLNTDFVTEEYNHVYMYGVYFYYSPYLLCAWLFCPLV